MKPEIRQGIFYLIFWVIMSFPPEDRNSLSALTLIPLIVASQFFRGHNQIKFLRILDYYGRLLLVHCTPDTDCSAA
jgi:hypothetical protein